MRLSELSTENTADVLCEIAPHFENIITDDELMEILKSKVDLPENSTIIEKITLLTSKATKILPIILKKRKNDVFGILGALNGKTIEEIANQNILKTMSQIRDIKKDKELLDFFKSCTGTEGSE